MYLERISASSGGLTPEEIRGALLESLAGRKLRKVLILPPDFTRFHSNAGYITNTYYHVLAARGCQVDIMPALGTHAPMSPHELTAMYGDIPQERFLVHNWRRDVVRLGEVPGDYVARLTEGLWSEPVDVEINRRLLEGGYDLILSVGQVVPHEVVGMANHAKNLFVGVGGKDMINKSHMIGAVYGMERMMGKDHTPVRAMLDYSLEHYLSHLPIVFVLTVCTAPGGVIHQHGLFIGDERRAFESAVKLAQVKNMDILDKPIQKCVVYLDPEEFKSTWLGNKSVYRTRMAIADGGELLVLAPGVYHFGEDEEMDALIRKYGYRGRLKTLEEFQKPENKDLRDNMGGAAHLIHGSSDGRFTITYAVRDISRAEVESVGFRSADYGEMAKTYDPAKLVPGYQTVGGEEIFYIPNPALGLWVEKSKLL